MKIEIVTKNKQDFLPLLSLADDPRFITDYLEIGTLFVSEDRLCAALVTDEGSGCMEIQNVAVVEDHQGEGFGKEFLRKICQNYPNKILKVRTDEYTANFYEKCGFIAYKRVKNYFPRKYGKHVFDHGRELIDNIYLKKEAKE